MARTSVLIEDTTLREGEQTPGVAFKEKQKFAIVEALAKANIKYIEIGIPVMGSVEFHALQLIAREFSTLTLIGWNRGLRTDIERSFDAGLTAIHIGLPSSDIHIKEKFGRDQSWVIETAIELVEYAKSQQATFISVSAEDMGRADIDFLKKYAKALETAGATRMRLSDTIGCLTPSRVTEIVRVLKQETNLPLQLHMHNDFNLALANVLAGVEAGASQVHATINGLGERAGITSIHQAVVGLHLIADAYTNVEMKELVNLSALVEMYTGLPIAYNEPVIGKYAFTHESGIHVDGILKVKESFEAFSPELVGRHHEFVLGKHSGSHAVEHILKQNGFLVNRETAKSLLPLIRELSVLMGGYLDPQIVIAILKNTLIDHPL